MCLLEIGGKKEGGGKRGRASRGDVHVYKVRRAYVRRKK
jgi:hypothetical protein